jgi:hypothetical protein
MTWSMIGGTLVSTSSDTNQRLALMVSNHTQCIGMELKVNVSVHQSKRAMNVCGNIKAEKSNQSHSRAESIPEPIRFPILDAFEVAYPNPRSHAASTNGKGPSMKVMGAVSEYSEAPATPPTTIPISSNDWVWTS